MTGIKWTKEAVLLLIEKVQKYECLYNVQNVQYLDRVKKAAAYNTLCYELKNMVKGLRPDDVKKKIHTLRSQYVKELKLVDTSQRNACRVDDIYTPKLWCYDMMDFLRPHCRKRISSSIIEEKSTDFSDDDGPCYSKESNPEKKKSTDYSDDDGPCYSKESNPEKKKNTDYSDDDGPCYSKEINPEKKMKYDRKTEGRKKIDVIQEILAQRLDHRKLEYKWLGDQITFQMGNIRSASIKQETARGIQDYINAQLDKDKAVAEPNLYRRIFAERYTKK